VKGVILECNGCLSRVDCRMVTVSDGCVVTFCPACLAFVGRAWQDATTEVVSVRWEVRDGGDAWESSTLDRARSMVRIWKSGGEWHGGRIVRITRRRRLAALAERGGR